jgi:hypothetical protein
MLPHPRSAAETVPSIGAEIERKLDRLQRELDELRRELRRR